MENIKPIYYISVLSVKEVLYLTDNGTFSRDINLAIEFKTEKEARRKSYNYMYSYVNPSTKI